MRLSFPVSLILGLLTPLFFALITKPALAGDGVGAGGGGDAATEMRMDEIRGDFYNWIKKDGAKELELPSDISYELYKRKMLELLSPDNDGRYHAVVLGSVTNEEEEKAEQAKDFDHIVKVNGDPKTCRGFLSLRDNKLHILCSVERLAGTPAAGQYRQMHHEFASLVLLEKNINASSDYLISKKISDALVKKIAKPSPTTRQVSLINCTDSYGKTVINIIHTLGKITGRVSKSGYSQNYGKANQPLTATQSSPGIIEYHGEEKWHSEPNSSGLYPKEEQSFTLALNVADPAASHLTFKFHGEICESNFIVPDSCPFVSFARSDDSWTKEVSCTIK